MLRMVSLSNQRLKIVWKSGDASHFEAMFGARTCFFLNNRPSV
jgi:hypothetical protein